MTNENMAQRITQLRKKKQLTQKELAAQLGVTDKAVSKWERGLSYPDISLLSKLSNLLGISIAELVNGEKSASYNTQSEVFVQETPQIVQTQTSHWKTISIAAGTVLFCGFIIFLGTSAIDMGLSWVIFPVTLLNILWVASIAGTFIKKKNKAAAILLYGFIIFTCTYYYSSLNQPVLNNVAANHEFPAFPEAYLPHYSIILTILFVSVIVTGICMYDRKKKLSPDLIFLLGAGYLSMLIISFLTVSSIMEYVDMNGLGVNPLFTLLLLLSWFLYTISMSVLLRRRHQLQ